MFRLEAWIIARKLIKFLVKCLFSDSISLSTCLWLWRSKQNGCQSRALLIFIEKLVTLSGVVPLTSALECLKCKPLHVYPAGVRHILNRDLMIILLFKVNYYDQSKSIKYRCVSKIQLINHKLSNILFNCNSELYPN